MDSSQRKKLSVSLSAPGKIILFGEYSVVFNKPAVASSLCHLRTQLKLTESTDQFVHLKLPLLHLSQSFLLADIEELGNKESIGDWNEYLQSLKNSVVALIAKSKNSADLTSEQMNSLMAFFHSFKKCFVSSSGFYVTVESDLPTGSGIGSSASFSVVLAAAAFLYECHLKGNNIDSIIERNGAFIVNENSLDEISEMAYSCEKIFHGSPSGVDNNTVLRGSMLEFVKANDGSSRMKTITTRPIDVLLVNTNVERSTKTLVENVRQLLKNHPEVIECVLNAMGNVAQKAITILNDWDRSPVAETHFGELITLNHNLLRVLGVSHPSLERIVCTANKYKLCAKLTGAGGGGFAFVYLPSCVEKSVIEKIKSELTTANFTVSEAIIGGPGLTIDEVSLEGNI